MQKIILVALVFGGFYLSGRQQFSEAHVRKFLLDQTVNVFQGNNETACDTFADDVEVTIDDRSPQGRWEVEGGKDEVCGYIKQASASFVVLGAQVNTILDNLEIRRSGFPWMTAELAYRQKTSIAAGGGAPIPPMTAVSEDRMTVKRTLDGLRITRLEARSRTTVE
jgi:hypothetical protein